MAIFRVEKNKNYTVMSNYHLKDRQLSLKAKGLLSLMLSLPESWDYTTRGIAFISKEGESAITSTLTELEERGYLTRRRLRNELGHLCETEYTIHEKSTQAEAEPTPKKPKKTASPNLENPRLEKCPVGENAPISGVSDDDNTPAPDLDYPDLGFPDLDVPDVDNPNLGYPDLDYPREDYPNLENRGQLSTNLKNKDLSNTHPSHYPSNQSNPSRTEGMDLDGIDGQRRMIQQNIDFDSLVQQYGQARPAELVELMLETLCSSQPIIRVSNAEYPAVFVKNRLLSLTFMHIQYVFDCMDESKSDIRNIKAYLLTSLFNASATMEHYYDAKVKHDLGGCLT